ncbi:MAG: Bax inhibitor-1/YccA family protein [Muribaculaceae bacterium]|nr:Bax inhibitor-1/YccA family protein [Muribaculaceae bacterium]
MNYNNLPPLPQANVTQAAPYQSEWSLSTYMSQVMRKVYVKMTLGLLVTALVSLYLWQNPEILMKLSGFIMPLILVELGLVFALSLAINKLKPAVATAMFYAYAILNGITLSPIFYVYTSSSIALTFFVTSGVFLAMSIYGYTTKRDLTKIGSFLVMALIGLIICTVVNIFLKSDTMSWIISFAGVIIFIGLTAWDTQKIKEMAQETDVANASKLATIGALSLYLDFINLFLYLLRILGSRE